MKGILIIGHGSRAKEAQQEFMTLVEKVRNKSQAVVEGCFMELAEPDFFSTVEKLMQQGITAIQVMPLFLFNGIHIQEDIPQMIKQAADKHPQITFTFGSPIGPCDELADLIVHKSEDR